MKFEQMSTGDALGARLAHSLRVEGLSLRKGHVLGADELRALEQAGIDVVTACRLEPDDVEENEAAQRIAAPLIGADIEAGKAFTGRVNLHARSAGVLRVDAGVIDAVNRLDEALTVATLADWEPVVSGQLVATIKIIPFAAPADAVSNAVRLLEAAGAPLQLHCYRGISAFLIQTTLPSVKASVLDKTVAITRERVAQVGGRLVGERRCAHDTEAVADAVREAPPADVLLIAGASAITDRRDVLPAGVERAGGRVLHFGMPVDPGNLLLLAERDGGAVVGLPGCARSPKLNGFDWVLQRLGAGLTVDRTQIMAMGVGGLLAEIPTRPQPREVTPPAGEPKVAVIVLAAGQSRRMGRTNKLTELWGAKPLVTYSVDAACASRATQVVVVTGNEPERVEAALRGRAVRFAHNPNYATGLASSLKTGLAALADDIDGALICLGDMPRLTTQHLNRLIVAFDPEHQQSLVVPTVDGKRGNPVLWGRQYFDAMQELAGDVGARHLIGQHEDVLVEVAMDDDAALTDIDTPAALDALRNAGR